MRNLHIITALGDGGAEHTLYKICKYDKNNEHLVISLKGPGKYYSLLKHSNIIVGNSSSGILEAPILKTPTINIY